MFKNNKYKKIYLKLVNTRRQRVNCSEQIYEKHHILPKAIWPEYKNSSWNIVSFTPREHFVAHRLLTRCLTGKAKSSMMTAMWFMTKSGRYSNVVSSRCYEVIRLEHIKNVKQHGFGKYKTERQISKLKEALSKNYILYNPKNELIYVTNLRQFALSNNLSPGSMANVVSGRVYQYKGYRLTVLPNLHKNSKAYKLIKEGQIIEVLNLKLFAKSHDLDYSALHKMVSGKEKSYRGYTI